MKYKLKVRNILSKVVHQLYCIVKDSPFKSFDLRRGGGGGVQANNFRKLDFEI